MKTKEQRKRGMDGQGIAKGRGLCVCVGFKSSKILMGQGRKVPKLHKWEIKPIQKRLGKGIDQGKL